MPARRPIAMLLFSLLLPFAVGPVAAADVAYIYDALGRLVAVVDGATNEVAAYRYDAVGNLLAIERRSAAVVSIIEFAPSSGPVGASITIYGTGFSSTVSENSVAFNGVAASLVSATPTQLVTTVPAGATTGTISVTAPGGSATSTAVFTVEGLGAPTITGFTPTVGTPGTPITITGTNFEPDPVQDKVRFNSVVYAGTTAATPTTVSATVPGGTGSGRLAVTTPGGTAVSTADFFVPPSPYTAADVEVTGRMAIDASSQTVTFTTANTIALIVVDAAAGQRAKLGVAGVTLSGSTLVAVDHPNGTPFMSTYVTTTGGAMNLTFPAAGTYTIRVDPAGASTGNLTLSFAAPDLAVTELTAPASARAGESISVSWTVANQGTGSAPPSWYDYLYLSTDAVCCAGDTNVTTSLQTTALATANSYTVTRSFSVPNVPAGTYYLILVADAWDGFFEASETNNVLAVPITVTTPDLTPTALTAPASATTQQTISMSWTVANQGTGAAQGFWADQVYLSTDQECCTGDTFVAGLNRTTHAAGTSYTETRSVTVPQVPAGNYSLIAVADRFGAVYEASETNNQLAIPITITTPDLTPTALTAPASAPAGGSITVSWTVANQGSGTAFPTWSDYVYLSTDQTCCTGDSFLTSASKSGVATGSSYTQTRTVTVPSVAPGAYYLILRTDHLGNLYEASEANNQLVIPFTVSP